MSLSLPSQCEVNIRQIDPGDREVSWSDIRLSSKVKDCFIIMTEMKCASIAAEGPEFESHHILDFPKWRLCVKQTKKERISWCHHLQTLQAVGFDRRR